ncbi:hypothetical protein soil367_08490 [Hydrocarboniclastica marina]|uniref:Uncharacterized protein n=1 Tax=Hydrocarboniclastica marina TaxID=2259620 RepID=A0A4P7XGW2_9ALTE|nr:hypothetical protein soil367_08490 [Hydrocarboniclastica marina]
MIGKSGGSLCLILQPLSFRNRLSLIALVQEPRPVVLCDRATGKPRPLRAANPPCAFLLFPA